MEGREEGKRKGGTEDMRTERERERGGDGEEEGRRHWNETKEPQNET